jgi:hypothetical protein
MNTNNVPVSTIECIASLRAEVSALAAQPDVLAMISAGAYHPDLRLGDAIQALDELAYALDEFSQSQVTPLPTLETETGVSRPLLFQVNDEQ